MKDWEKFICILAVIGFILWMIVMLKYYNPSEEDQLFILMTGNQL